MTNAVLSKLDEELHSCLLAEGMADALNYWESDKFVSQAKVYVTYNATENNGTAKPINSQDISVTILKSSISAPKEKGYFMLENGDKLVLTKRLQTDESSTTWSAVYANAC